MNVAAIIETMEALGHKPADILAVVKAAASKSVSDGAERTRRWREKKAQEAACDVTVMRHGDVTENKKEIPPTPPKEKTTSLTNVRENSNARTAFDRVRKAYPRRQGRDPNDTARKSLAKALAAGASIDEIEAGALAFAKFRSADDARFTPMLATCLIQRGLMDDYTGPPPRDGPAPKISNLAKLAMGTFFDDGNSAHHTPPAEPSDRGNVIDAGDVPDGFGARPRLLGHPRASGTGWR
jgi:hypothetical protein